MRGKEILGIAVAVSALLACSKSSSEEDRAAPVANDDVRITQSKPPAGGTWADVTNETAAGGYVMGNPDAGVKLLEIASLSCPHCKKFEDEGASALVDKYVKSGKVSWEFRPFLIHGSIDMAANLIARCNGAKTFFPLVRSLYKDQSGWLGKIESTPQDKVEQVQALPKEQMFVGIADILGLQDWAAARGVPYARSSQCLSDSEMIDQQVQISSDVSSQFPDFTGTPAFVINGTMLPKDVTSWAKLEPRLQDALK